jgi:thiol-disulfide isomerase/thioredoxin
MKKYELNIPARRMDVSRLLISFFLVVLITCSCHPDSGKGGNIAFKANPQRVEKQEIQTLELGEKAPDFNLPDVSGIYCKLSDFDKAHVLVVVFTCNHCPTAQAYEDRIIRFVKDYKDKNVALVAIMPNSQYALLLEECGYSDLDDTYENMIIRARDKHFNFPYLYDGDNHIVSIKYGPTATPHAFVFNKNRELTYRGRLDNSEKPGTANAEDLRNAVDQTLRGEPVTTPDTKVFGCSIKWAWKTDWADKVNNEWLEKPVTLNKAGIDTIAWLIENHSPKLRLINVWATWCGPCIIEYPELIKINRMYHNRNFEFVSISADNPENTDKVLQFLTTRHSAVQNYLYDGKDKYALINAIDPEWDGALPYSILIEPGGNIVYSMVGAVDLLVLKHAIIENPLMGRYY